MRAAAAVAMLLIPSLAQASGIELQEQDARAQGRVLAVRAMLDNPATLFFNPAGLAYLEGLAISAGDTLVFPSFSYSDPNGTHPRAETVNPLVAPPHAYASFATQLPRGGRLGAGLGVNFPFGMTIEWGEDFAGRHLVQESQLLIPQVQAGLAWSPWPQLSVGAALVLSPAHIYLRRYLGSEFGLVADDGSPITDAAVAMAGDGLGVGATVGIQARPAEWLYLGLVYRAAMSLELAGQTHFELPGLTDLSAFADQRVETAFQLPHIFALGMGARVGRWYGEIDLDYTLWSVLEEIPLTFPDDATGALSQALPQHWKDTFTLRLGNEVTISDAFKVRAGGGYDQNPARDEHLSPMLPDSDRLFAALGAGYSFDFGLTLDLSYMVTYFLDRTVEGHPCEEEECPGAGTDGYGADGSRNWVGNRFPASYRSLAQLLAVTAEWAF